jgi:nucleolar complex protein 3
MVTKDQKKIKNDNPKSAKRKLPSKPYLPSRRIIEHLDEPISQLTTAQRCEHIAEISESILEDPQSAFATHRREDGMEDNDESTSSGPSIPSKMRRLLEMANPSKNNNDENTTRLAVLSLLAIFQDVIPSYRIRLPSSAEMAVRVSKETKQLWNYERALLTSYQQYLKLLDSLWERGNGVQHSNKKKKNQNDSHTTILSPLSVTAILCLTELLKSASHFNFRSNILSIVVRQMNHRTCDEVAIACCNSIAHVFEHDAQGEIALEASKMISKIVKDRFEKSDGKSAMAIRPEMIRTFVKIPLRVHVDEAEAAKLAEQAKAKKKKKDKEQDDIDSELKEGDATVDKILLARCQADTLHAVTLTYFRILKGVNFVAADSDGKQKKIESATELLAPALEGLAKFAHLINFDTVRDVLEVLKGLLKEVDSLPLDAALNCILTAFQTLQGPGRELQIDQKEYVSPLYGQLPRLITEGHESTNTELALKCLHAAFIKRKEYSTVRIAAFVKQLSTTAMHAPPFTSAPLLAFLRQILHRYPSATQLLENEQDVVTQGTYSPEVDDPEYTNPFATSAWELGTLKFHIFPSIEDQSKGAAAKKMLQLPSEDPAKIREGLVRNSKEIYIAFKSSKKKHPLYIASKKSSSNNRRDRSDVRFITPRPSHNYHLK